MRHLKLVPVIFLVCCVSEDNYLTKLGKTWCSRQEECRRGAFEQEYRDFDDCVDEYLDTWEPVQDCAIDVGCDWDPERSAECRNELRSVSCEEFVEGDWTDECEDTYDCSDRESIELAACLLTN